MGNDKEPGAEDGPSLMGKLKERMPETGVSLFLMFVLASMIGFFLAISGRLTLAMIVLGGAIVSVLLLLLTPSPSQKAKRAALQAPLGEEMEEEAEERDVEDISTRPDLLVDDTAAPTSTRRATPLPPPEPPPLEDIVVDELPEDEAPAEEEAPAEDVDDVWVE